MIGSVLRYSHGCGLLEAELQESFAGDLNLLVAREHLHCSPRTRTDAGSDGRAFAAACDCADDGAKSGTAAYFLSRVRATTLALQRVIAADDRVVAAVDDHAR